MDNKTVCIPTKTFNQILKSLYGLIDSVRNEKLKFQRNTLKAFIIWVSITKSSS